MAFDFKKSISLITTCVLVVLISVVGYYFINLGKGPYKASDFVSISYKWGVGDTLANSYDSATGDYQYLDSRDSLLKTNVKLRANNIIFIHSKADELNLWQLPDVIANPNANLKSDQVLRYEFVFTYEKKKKKIIYLTDYNYNPDVASRADGLQKMIKQTIDEAEERYSKR